MLTVDKIRDDVLCGEDGFYFFWPTGAKGGFTANDLRIIANELDNMNKDWSQKVHNSLEKTCVCG